MLLSMQPSALNGTFRTKPVCFWLRNYHLLANMKKLKFSIYMKAIEESRSSHFVHEEGLACELAGMHYGRRGDITKAKELFQQAENCYETWGSALQTRIILGKS